MRSLKPLLLLAILTGGARVQWQIVFRPNLFVGDDPPGSINAFVPDSRLQNSWQNQDNWNYVLGKHQLKAGVNWTYQRTPNSFLPGVGGGLNCGGQGGLVQARIGAGTGPSVAETNLGSTVLISLYDAWNIGTGCTSSPSNPFDNLPAIFMSPDAGVTWTLKPNQDIVCQLANPA